MKKCTHNPQLKIDFDVFVFFFLLLVVLLGLTFGALNTVATIGAAAAMPPTSLPLRSPAIELNTILCTATISKIFDAIKRDTQIDNRPTNVYCPTCDYRWRQQKKNDEKEVVRTTSRPVKQN